MSDGNNLMRTGWLALVSTAALAAGFPEVVKVDGGELRGAIQDGIGSFRGIPYAAPPVGGLRWRAPRRAPAWAGVREALRYGSSCLQGRSPDAARGTQSEDCLYLNVWTGAAAPGERRPVMVWIHGGGLQNGSGSGASYEGSALAAQGVVVVTINYRLNVFGFLGHAQMSAEDEHGSSGNFGFLDQIAALEWVRRNIGAFGGDSANITIFGESSGSWSVNALMASPLARGLFHRAIGESGGLLEPNPHLKTSFPGADSAERIGERFFAAIGAESLAAARAKPAAEVLAAAFTEQGTPRFRFSPSVDGWFWPDEVFALYAAAKHHDVPLLLGFNADEGAQFAERPAAVSAEAWEEAAKRQFGELAAGYLKLYPGATPEQRLDSAARRFRDERHLWKMRTWAAAMAGRKSKAYLYYFSRIPPGPDSARLRAHHAAEIPYVFANLARLNRPWTETDRRVSAAMSAAWVRFARTGDPNGGDLPRWRPYDHQSSPYLEFGDTIVPGGNLHPEAFSFWDRYFATQRARRATP